VPKCPIPRTTKSRNKNIINLGKHTKILKQKIIMVNRSQTLKQCKNFIERMNNDIKRRSTKKMVVRKRNNSTKSRNNSTKSRNNSTKSQNNSAKSQNKTVATI
jgi:hypothetical protein